MVWVGDFRDGYKTAPEAQHLFSWAGAQGMQPVNRKQSIKQQSSSQHSHSMHMYLRTAADGSKIVLFDVSFPQHLPSHVAALQNTLQQHSSWGNATASLAGLPTKVSQQAAFYPSNAAAADWQAPLDDVCNSLCSIATSGPGRVVVTAPVYFSQVNTSCSNPFIGNQGANNRTACHAHLYLS